MKFFSYPYYKNQDTVRQARKNIVDLLEKSRRNKEKEAHKSQLDG